MRRQRIISLSRKYAPSTRTYAVSFPDDPPGTIRPFPDFDTTMSREDLDLTELTFEELPGDSKGWESVAAFAALIAGIGVKFSKEFIQERTMKIFRVRRNS